MLKIEKYSIIVAVFSGKHNGCKSKNRIIRRSLMGVKAEEETTFERRIGKDSNAEQ